MKLNNVEISVDRVDDGEEDIEHSVSFSLGRFGRFSAYASVQFDGGVLLVPQMKLLPVGKRGE